MSRMKEFLIGEIEELEKKIGFSFEYLMDAWVCCEGSLGAFKKKMIAESRQLYKAKFVCKKMRRSAALPWVSMGGRQRQTSAEFTECKPSVAGRQGDGSPRYRK